MMKKKNQFFIIDNILTNIKKVVLNFIDLNNNLLFSSNFGE